ncbi:hypothetical protein [Psychromicrobium xiongbiense]|uniref:hypothetical protein n=1 Tax=Psychromicrobium xiongbiense TaxID=3051184 RepID=UPI0025537836|nr:hypothetical protein [Psychromicrobium sp. YIM S02556]
MTKPVLQCPRSPRARGASFSGRHTAISGRVKKATGQATPALALLIVVLLAVLTGCSSTSGGSGIWAPAGSGGGSAPTATAAGSQPGKDRTGTDNSPATPRSDFNLPTSVGPASLDSKGFLHKQIGQLAGVIRDNDPNIRLASFSVAAITANFSCPVDPALKPKNGHFVAVEMWVETYSLLSSSTTPYFGVSPRDFDIIAPDGAITPGTALDTWPAHACLDDGTGLPARIGPSQKERGLVILDSPVAAGSVVLSQQDTKGSGWLWNIPG